MGFFGERSMVFLVHLIISVIILISQIHADTSKNDATSSESCTFPEYLQTDCAISSSVCEWNTGQRISVPIDDLSSPPSNFRAVRGTTKWTWKVAHSVIFISFMQDSLSRTKTLVKEYHCVAKRNDTFLIRQKDISNHGADSSSSHNSFNCIQFVPRSRSVIQFKLGSWVKVINDGSCAVNTTFLQDLPLISDRYYGVLDCPLELKGYFEILDIYDGLRQRRCSYSSGKYGVLESDCLSKEGIVVDFGHDHNCTDPSLGNSYPQELKLRCHSMPWTQGNITYVMTSRQARWAREYEKTTFHCLMYNSNQSEFYVRLTNEPRCSGFGELQGTEKSNSFVFRVRRKSRVENYKFLLSNRCKLPADIQGIWLEESNHSFTTLQINQGNLTLQSGDTYQCKERYIFKYRYPGCGEDRWPLHGKVGFHYDDYTMISTFQNGCRPRITRLGLSSTMENNVLVYRLSQSEPIVDVGISFEQFYKHEIFKRLCSLTYLYKQDPYPHWGRNIEKVVYQKQLITHPIEKCSLLFNRRNLLMSTVAVTRSSKCIGKITKIYFGCKEPRERLPRTINIAYNAHCSTKDSGFQCIGRAWKYGHFVLVRDVVTQRMNCLWFDKKSNAILRVDSPQCSEVDFGAIGGHAERIAEKFEILYFERCPYVPEPTIGAKIAVITNGKDALISRIDGYLMVLLLGYFLI